LAAGIQQRLTGIAPSEGYRAQLYSKMPWRCQPSALGRPDRRPDRSEWRAASRLSAARSCVLTAIRYPP